MAQHIKDFEKTNLNIKQRIHSGTNKPDPNSSQRKLDSRIPTNNSRKTPIKNGHLDKPIRLISLMVSNVLPRRMLVQKLHIRICVRLHNILAKWTKPEPHREKYICWKNWLLKLFRDNQWTLASRHIARVGRQEYLDRAADWIVFLD